VQVASGVSRPLPPAGEARRPEPAAQGRETAPNLPRVVTPPPQQAAPAAARRAGASAAVVWLAVGLLAALAGTTAWWALAHTEQREAVAAPRGPEAPTRPAVAPPAAAPAGAVTVELATVPAGAEVFEDGVLVGKTPISRQWPADAVRTVAFKLSGFVAVERAYRLQHSERFEVLLEAVAKRPAPITRPGPKAPAPAENIPAFE
jgi:hypothetical protein